MSNTFRDKKCEMYTAAVFVDPVKRLEHFYHEAKPLIDKAMKHPKAPELKKSKQEAETMPLFGE